MISLDDNSMIDFLEKHQERLGSLGKEYRVRRLELFGSATKGGRFDPTTSDLDFLVEFLPIEPGQRADMYFGLREGLEALFERPIDLVVKRAIKNPYFLKAIAQDRELLYAA